MLFTLTLVIVLLFMVNSCISWSEGGVRHSCLWDFCKCLELKGVQKKHTNSVDALYSNTAVRVRAHDEQPPEHSTSNSVCQRCPLPRILFNSVMSVRLVIKLSSSDFSGTDLLPEYSFMDLQCADDMVWRRTGLAFDNLYQ